MGVCQIIVTALYMMSLGLYLAKDGKPKEGKYNFLEALIMTIIILVLLWKGGLLFMIAIPNMDQPKSCYNHCNFIAMEEVGCPLKDYIESHQYKNRTHPACPLIEIVQCKDCKWWDNNNGANRCTHESGGMWAKPNAFCSYGELKEKDNTVCQGHKCP